MAMGVASGARLSPGDERRSSVPEALSRGNRDGLGEVHSDGRVFYA